MTTRHVLRGVQPSFPVLMFFFVAVHCFPALADGQGVETNWVVDDAIEAFENLTHHGEWLAFHPTGHEGWAGNKFANHIQGIARRPGPGTPYMVVTRAVENADEHSIYVVKMASRDESGERLRSNRLEKDRESSATTPPPEDEIVHAFHAEFDNCRYNHPGGIQIVDDIVAIPLTGPFNEFCPKSLIIFLDLSPLPDNEPEFVPYAKILDYDAGAVALSKLPGGDGYILATKHSDPEVHFYTSPIENLRDLRTNNEWLHFYHYDTVNANEVDGWPVRNSPNDPSDPFDNPPDCIELLCWTTWLILQEINDLDPRWLSPGQWKTDFQSFSFITDEDDKLYLAGFYNTNPKWPNFCGIKPCNNYGRLYEVTGFETSSPIVIEQVTTRKKFYTRSSEGRNNANFNAAGSAYVSPTGELLVYGVYHWPEGPGDTVPFVEWRHQDVFRKESPNYAPQINLAGNVGPGLYEVNEGSSIEFGNVAAPPLAKAWIELFVLDDFEFDSVVFDVEDSDKEDWDDFTKLDRTFADFKVILTREVPFTNPPEVEQVIASVTNPNIPLGFERAASSVRWFAPPGASFTLHCSAPTIPEDFFLPNLYIDGEYYPCNEDDFVLHGTGKPENIASLGEESWYRSELSPVLNNANDAVGSISHGGPEEGSVESLEWTIMENPSIGDLIAMPGEPLRYDAVEGKYLNGEPMGAVISFSACSNLTHCDPAPCCNTVTARIVVVNVPPEVQIDRIEDQTGTSIDDGVMPVLLEALEYDLSGSFTDAGVLDAHTAEIDWGDGLSSNSDEDLFFFTDSLDGETGTVNVPHIYASKGMYTMVLTVEDDDGDAGQAMREVEVVDAAGALEILIEALSSRLDSAGDSERRLLKALEKLQGKKDGAGKNGALDKFEEGKPKQALEKIKQALKEIEYADKHGTGLDLNDITDGLALAAKSQAASAVAAAEVLVSKPSDMRKVQKAKDLLAEGDEFLDMGDYVEAVQQYRKAFDKVKKYTE